MSQSKVQTRFFVAAALVLGLGAAFRIPHLDWGLPSVEEEAFPSKVAIGMWGFDDGSPNLDPGTAGWPALSFYVQRTVQQFHYMGGRLTGRFAGPLDYYVAWLRDPTDVILLGRTISVFCGLLVCLLALLIGRQLGGLPAGALAGLLCAVSPLLIQHSQMVEPDALVVVFSSLALLWCVRIATAGRMLDYALAGLWIGLGTASKYTPALMALTLYLVHLERRRAEGQSNRYLGLDDRRLGWAALVSFLAFCVASPYTLADLAVLRRDFAYQALHMSSGHFGHEQEGVGYLYYLLHVLPGAVGWPVLVTGLAGLAWTVRGPRAERVVLWSWLPYMLVLGGLSTHFDRYMLPTVLPLTLGSVLLVLRVGRRIGRPGLAAGLAVLLLVPWPVRTALDFHRLQGMPSTQQLAASWLKTAMDPATEVLATEGYGPDLPRDRREEFQADPAFKRMSPEQQERLLAIPFYRTLTLPMYSVRTELAAYYYDLRNYLAYDWLVTSGAVRNRYLGQPDRYPRQVQFYTLLDEFADPAWSIQPRGNVRGPALQVYRVDDRLRAAIRSRLGPLELDHFLAFVDRVHAPHFLNFAQTVATHAAFRNRHVEAAFWYEILTLAGTDAPTVALGCEKAGQEYLALQDLDKAEEMFTTLERFPERSALAWGNLGLIAELRGDRSTARELYERVIERDPSGEPGAWARRRLARLEETGG